MKHKYSIVLIFISFIAFSAHAQDTVQQKDLMGLIFGEKKKNDGQSRKERRFEFGALPYIAASPSSGLKFGAVSNIHYRLGNDSTTKKSAGTVSLAYTTKKQLYFYFRDLTYFPRNQWAADFDIRYNNNNENTYGLGTQTEKSAKELLNFSTIRSNISLMYRISKALYAGGGINYNYYYNIRGYEDTVSDPYYQYNTSLNINPTHSTAAGFNLAALYDTRDNIINAYRGINLRATYSVLMKILGSDQAWQHLWAELRAFKSLTANHKHRLALWSYASIVFNDDVPYMNLPAVGYDLMGKSARGYTIGRYRGNQLLYAELEYRASLVPSDLIGAVVFVNASTASTPDKSIKLMQYVSPAAGVGLRLKLNKFSRTNISIDYAVGKHSSGFYLDISETF